MKLKRSQKSLDNIPIPVLTTEVKTGTTLSAGGAPGADAGGAPPPDAGGAPPPPDAGAPLPESIRKDKNKLILESNEDDFNEDEFLDFKKINNSLGDLEDQLSKLLGD